MNLGRRNRVKAEGGMSSMTDLVFLMLIFFIIMSTMSEPGIPVDLPSGENVENTNTKAPINVGVNPNNLYNLADDVETFYSYEELEPLLISMMAERLDEKDKTLKISGDKTADYEFVFKLIALAKQKKWKPILVFQ